MSKRIHHMGMTLDKEGHERFHEDAPDLSPAQHEALMKKMGVTKEQDEEWHRTHFTLGEQRTMGLKHIEPVAVGAAFVEWCAKQGWLVQRGNDYFATKDGIRELRERFGIQV